MVNIIEIEQLREKFQLLTPTPRKVLFLLLEGYTDNEIAEKIQAKASTVRKYIQKLCDYFELKRETFGLKRNRREDLIALKQHLTTLFAQYQPELANELSSLINHAVTERKIAKLLITETQALSVKKQELPAVQVPTPFKLCYIERPPIEEKCYNAILQPGALIRIKAPRKMGKTLLLENLFSYVRQGDYKTVKLDLKLADSTVLASLKSFLQWFCVNVSDSLELEAKVDEYWLDQMGLNTSCTRYFQRYLLSATDSPLVLAIDNFERLFKYENIFSEFCLLLRSWYETAKQGDRMGIIWKKLRLVVVNSTEVYPTLDTNRSPFNVGLAVELPEFNQQQVGEMAKLYEIDGQLGEDGLSQLMALVGGHPYLVQEALTNLKSQEISLDELLTLAPTEEGIFSHYLRQQLGCLQDDSQLEAAYKDVVMAMEPVQLNPEVTFKLHSLGLVKIVRNDCVPSCDLYRQYFLTHLG